MVGRAGPIHGAANRMQAVPSGAPDRFESVRAGDRVGDEECGAGNPDIMRRPGNRDGPLQPSGVVSPSVYG